MRISVILAIVHKYCDKERNKSHKQRKPKKKKKKKKKEKMILKKEEDDVKEPNSMRKIV